MSELSFQTAVSLIYPPRCLGCGDKVTSDFGLCGPCWRDTLFIGGAICDCCSVPLPGNETSETLKCDECMKTPRPWTSGRSALVYKGNGRRMVLALKHGDRQEIARPAAKWMAQAMADIPKDNMIIAPVPLHWTRMVKRRYNQSALLAQALARHEGLPVCPDLLIRQKRTKPMENMSKEVRFSSVKGAISVHPRRRHRLAARPVLIVDDVLTSGATLAASADACIAAGSGPVYVITLARTVRDA